MRHRQSLSPRLATLARQQAGVLTTAQLLDGGLTHRVIHRMAQEWQQPCRGVYLTSEPSWETAAWAGILRAGDAAVVTGHAAAYLHKLIPDPPQSIVIAGAKQLAPLLIGGRLVSFRRISRAGMGSPSRALVEAAIVDMARDGGEDDVVAALACALAENKTTAERVLGEVGRRKRTAHSTTLRTLCRQAMKGIESALEWRFHQVLVRHGLPIPERQTRTEAGRVDGLYRDAGLVVELDGLRFHNSPGRDAMRDNENLIASELHTLRYVWGNVVRDACSTASQVERALLKWGWRGEMRRCRVCPPEASTN